MIEHFINLWGAGALLSGLGYITWVACKQRRVLQSQTWPAATGQIVRSELVRKTSLTGPSRTPNRIFSAQIEYRYMVGPRVYTGKTICIGGELNTSFREGAEERVHKYAEGSTVPVYYDPWNPATSCLERRGEIAAFGYLMGGAFTLLGLLVLLDIFTFRR